MLENNALFWMYEFLQLHMAYEPSLSGELNSCSTNKEVEIIFFIQCCNLAAKARLQDSWVDFQPYFCATKLDQARGGSRKEQA